MNKVPFKDLLCYLCLPGTVVASWLFTQEVEGSNTAFCKKYFSNSTDSIDSIEFIEEKLYWRIFNSTFVFASID